MNPQMKTKGTRALWSYSLLPITAQSGIWALGCLLYMICYKKLPFEGKLAIIINHYVIPRQPQYSEKIRNLSVMFVTKLGVNKASDVRKYIKAENMGPFSEMPFLIRIYAKQEEWEDLGKPQNDGREEVKTLETKVHGSHDKNFKRLTTKREGCLLSALGENEEGPKRSMWDTG